MRSTVIFSITALLTFSTHVEGKPKQQSIDCASDILVSVKKPKLSESIVALNKADRFDGSATGYAATKSPNYLAYERSAKLGKKAQEELKWVLRHGSPAGRLYAALLLKRIDNNLGESAFSTLEKDSSEVQYDFGGCVVSTGKVKRVAEQLLRFKGDF